MLDYLPPSPRERGRRRLASLLRQECGASVVEYVLLLGIAAVMLVFAGEALHSLFRHSLGDGLALAPPGSQISAPRQPAAAAEGQEAAQPAARSALKMLLVVAALGCSAALAVRVRRPPPAPRDAHQTGDELQLLEWASQAVFQKRQSLLRAMAGDIDALHSGGLEVRYLMSTDLAIVRRDASLGECAEEMSRRRCRHLLVCDGRGRLEGVISNRDLQGPGDRKASEVMTRGPFTVRSDARICPVISVMLQEHISCLPVVDDGRLLGVLTSTDLLLALQCALTALERSARLPSPERPTRRISDQVGVWA